MNYVTTLIYDKIEIIRHLKYSKIIISCYLNKIYNDNYVNYYNEIINFCFNLNRQLHAQSLASGANSTSPTINSFFLSMVEPEKNTLFPFFHKSNLRVSPGNTEEVNLAKMFFN